MNFGEQIKRIRKEKGLTQQDMADKLSISRQAVSNWENDKNLPDIEMLITMAQVFHLTLDELILGGTTQMNNITEKLIRDGSTNKRIKMNLIGIVTGSILLLLGLAALIAGTFVRPTLEEYWSVASSALVLGGIVTFMVIGVINTVELLRDGVRADAGHRKKIAFGGALMFFGTILFGITLITGWFSGMLGIAGIISGMIVIFVAALGARKV